MALNAFVLRLYESRHLIKRQASRRLGLGLSVFSILKLFAKKEGKIYRP